ncbi:MAG TPA: ABC transporter ATP-binding protein [Chthonomonadales bacterium]|nr:ABC transporter ATP-binding protein [Chthonomonadales bacterium]
MVLDDLGRAFGPRRVLAGVSASVGTGQVLAVTGPNGSGKSTLLRIVAGLLTPTWGSAEVIVAGTPRDPQARRRFIGYAAPDASLYAELSGVENLQFLARLRGVHLTREDLVAALGQVGLLGRGRDRVADYSSGMRHRLKLAAAVLCSPPVLLLDEPGSNLDAEGLEVARGLVEAQRRYGLAVLATNEPRESCWADDVLRLNHA